MQFRVYQGNQAVERAAVAAGKLAQQFRDPLLGRHVADYSTLISASSRGKQNNQQAVSCGAATLSADGCKPGSAGDGGD